MTDTNKTEAPEQVTRVAKAICAELCAIYGEPPCHEVSDEWPNPHCDEPGCMALAQAAIAADLSRPAPVTVKPLVWELVHESCWNELSGEYFIDHGLGYILYGRKSARNPIGERRNSIGRFDTPEEAKAAAQADYERRILSALTAQPTTTQAAQVLDKRTSQKIDVVLNYFLNHPAHRERETAMNRRAREVLTALAAQEQE